MKVVLLALATLTFFSANSLLCRMALSGTGMDAASYSVIRLASGAVFLWLLLTLKGQKPLKAGRFSASLALFLYMFFFSWAYLNLPAAAGNLVLVAAIQVSMLGLSIHFREKVRHQQLVGIGIAMVGLVVLLFPGLSAPPFISALIMCLAGLAWGVYSVMGRRVSDPALNTAGNFIRALPLTLLLLPFCESAPLNGVIYALAGGLIASGFGYILWYSLVPKISMATAGIIQLSVPIMTAFSAVILLGEKITLRLMISTVIILAGIVFAVIGLKNKQQKPPAK